MPKERYSLSRLVKSILERRTAIGYELEVANELRRSLSPDWKKKSGEPGLLVPSSAFGPPVTRELTVSGSGANLVGRKTQQLSGLIGWSACVNSGAQILGPFRASDVTIYSEGNLPTATWAAEIGSVNPSDIQFQSVVLSPKRIAAQVVISRQLLIQSVGSEPLDEYISSKIRLVFSNRLDQACLYGGGHPPMNR
jgi:hypothetical protein